MKIFILSPNIDVLFSNEQKAVLEKAAEVIEISSIKPLKDVAELYEGDEPRILAIDPDFCDWNLPNEVIDSMPNLKVICLQTTSFSWVDADHAKEKGIPVVNLRGFSSIAVAEWATMVVLALARRLPIVIKDGWKADFEKHRGVELRGKKAGVIGIGRIGTAFAENVAGLGMDVQYYSKTSRDDRFSLVSLEDLMSTSDVVFFSVANNDETKHLLTDELLTSMKPTAIFMNIVDPIYNHDLVLEMVKSGKLYGYGFEDSKETFGSHGGNVWNGPALGWCTDESMSKNAEQWVESILNAAKSDYPTQING
jgi:phosphoglycerate dehydrogenase-like enzyme